MFNVLMITPEVDKDHDTRGFIHEWVRSLGKRVKKMFVVTTRVGTVDLPSNIIVYSLNHSNKVVSLTRFYRTLFNIFRKEHVDIVFVHMIPAFALLVAPLCWLWRTPIVFWHTHGHVSMTTKLAYHFVNKVVTASEEGFRIASPKRVIVGHGIDTNLFSPRTSRSSNNIFTLMTVGRISPSKDYETVIKALSCVTEKTTTPFTYRIVGRPFPNTPRDDAYFSRLQKLVQEFNLARNVTFVGAIPNSQTPPYYQACDIFINPSMTGSLDKTGLEAMACGKPLVTCNESYIPLLNDHEDILFFQQKNPADLAEKLITLMAKPADERERLGLSLRKTIIERHNLERLMDKLINVFSDEIST